MGQGNSNEEIQLNKAQKTYTPARQPACVRCFHRSSVPSTLNGHPSGSQASPGLAEAVGEAKRDAELAGEEPAGKASDGPKR